MKTNLENYEERFVDYMEGQLNTAEMKEVEAFVAQHPELEEDFKLFCSSKLEPDTRVVFTKKESLMQPATVIRPLFAKILAAAACIALLIGLSVRFLKPHQELTPQPLLANLTPKTIQLATSHQDDQTLEKSSTPITPIPEPATENTVSSEPLEIVTMDPIAYQQLSLDNDHDNVDIRMFTELGERLAALEPFGDIKPSIENSIADPKDQAFATIQESFLDNVRQTTKELYKQTAKTVMDVYYTADYCINEAKNNIDVRRELVIPH